MSTIHKQLQVYVYTVQLTWVLCPRIPVAQISTVESDLVLAGDCKPDTRYDMNAQYRQVAEFECGPQIRVCSQFIPLGS